MPATKAEQEAIADVPVVSDCEIGHLKQQKRGLMRKVLTGQIRPAGD